MPTIDLDPDKVNALYQNGHISDDVYNSIMGQQVNASTPPQVMEDGFVRSPEEMARREEQQQILAHNQSGADALDERRNALALQAEQDVIEKKRALARKAGIDESTINQRLGLTAAVAPSNTSEPMAAGAPSLQSASDAVAPQAQGPGPNPTSPFDAGFNQQIEGVNDAANAASQKADDQNTAINNYLNGIDQIEKDRKKAEGERQTKIAAAVKDLDAATNTVAAMKVDPNHFWADASTGNKILMGVSLFLGAIGAANDGVNRVVPIITNAIDRDIASQKANIANAREGVNQKSNTLAQMRSIFKDDRMAEEATKIAALEKVKMQIMQKSMQYSRPEVQANAKKLVGELEVKKAEARQKFLDAASGSGLGALTASERLSRQKYDDERMTPLGMVQDPREAPKIRDMKGLIDPLRSNLMDLQDLTKEGRAFLPFTERAKKAEVLATDTQLQLKELARLGVLSQYDLELMQKMVPSDPTAIFQSNVAGRIEEVNKLVERKWKAYIEARGLKDRTLKYPER